MECLNDRNEEKKKLHRRTHSLTQLISSSCNKFFTLHFISLPLVLAHFFAQLSAIYSIVGDVNTFHTYIDTRIYKCILYKWGMCDYFHFVDIV